MLWTKSKSKYIAGKFNGGGGGWNDYYVSVKIISNTLKFAWWVLEQIIFDKHGKLWANTIYVWNPNSWNPGLSEIRTLWVWISDNPLCLKTELWLQILDILKNKCLRTKLVGNQKVNEWLKAMLVRIADIHCKQSHFLIGLTD